MPSATELPTPSLSNICVEDLRNGARLEVLYREAVKRKLLTQSEAAELRFFGAAEHAAARGSTNPAGLFSWLVRNGKWEFVTCDDEEAARVRLKAHRFGAFRTEVKEKRQWGRPSVELSPDALMVRTVKAKLQAAGYRGDPYWALKAKLPQWTRERWGKAEAELRETQRFWSRESAARATEFFEARSVCGV